MPHSETTQPQLDPGLYIVATPIGNLGDISARALEMLQQANFIACEDTRTTGKLLKSFAISTKMTPYHDHNAARARPNLIDLMQNGAAVALVSDAGTPLISDPGYKLVRDAVAAGLTVTTAPGPSAALAALTLAGVPSDRFTFLGFLPVKVGARRAAVAEISSIGTSLIIYESPRRLAATLTDLAAALGERPAAVARELTKLYEEVRRGSLGELAAHYHEAGPPKGETVIVIGPPATDSSAIKNGMETPAGSAMAQLMDTLTQTLSVRDAADLVAAATGVNRRDLYQIAIKARREDQ